MICPFSRPHSSSTALSYASTSEKEEQFKFEDDENDAEKTLNAYNALKDWGSSKAKDTREK